MTRRLSKPAWITLLLAASAVVTLALGETFSQPAYLAIGFCLYLTRQGVAICAVTILQEEVDDAYRGRVFAFYDMMFNAAYVAGAALSVAIMPANGHSPALIGLVAAGYAVLAAGYWLAVRRDKSSSGGRRGRDDPLHGGRPAQQFLSGPLPAQLALGDPQLEQEVVGPAHHRARGHAEDAHDLVAVELRPEPGQFLLLAELLDALFEAVVGAGQPGRLGAVPRGAVGPGQHVQPGEQRPGVADVPPDRGVGPLAVAIAMEPQVQFHQPGHVLHHVIRESQRGQPAPGHLRAHHLVQVERDPPVRQQGRVLGLPMSCSSAASRTVRSPSSPYCGSRAIACRSTVRLCW